MAPAPEAQLHNPGLPGAEDYDTKLKEYVKRVETTRLPPPPSAPVEEAHSGPQGHVVPLTIIDDPSAWKATDFAGHEDSYTYVFTSEDVAELTAAVDAIRARGVATEKDIKALTKADYALPTLAPKLVELAKNVTYGRGFQLLRGFPVEQYREDRVGLVIAYWGLALALGRVQVSQTDYHADGTVFGSILNHVTEGRWAKDFDAGYTRAPKINTNRLAFHSDQGVTDLISLLSLTAAKEGGESKWVSGVAIHNELIRRGRKDLVAELSKLNTWLVPKKADQAQYLRNPNGTFVGFEDTPPFEYHDGYLSVYFQSNNYQEIKLTPLQEEAVWTFAALAEDPEFYLVKKLQPGDIEWISNTTVLHSRTEVLDGPDNREKRHLLRWWVHTDANKRPIASHYAPRSNVQEGGGFRVPEGSNIRLPLYPYSRHA
ncbi:hypothetical protein WJX72_007708 [[Myrmecia] bisecta]|uniref:TauD/TfdA-like domain-containing protein n=1 Tax=[Myrmecia] bisecta TaxID=41462 RepID=A0AAW1PHN5_9CHLO